MGDDEEAIFEYARRGGAAVGELQTLLEKGADPNGFVAYDGMTAAMAAARFARAENLTLLLHHGADLEGRSEDGSSLLHHAAAGGMTAVVLDFVAATPGKSVNVNEVNEDGATALHLAAHYGRRECVERLLRAGAAVNAHAPGLGTALDCAQGKAAVAAVLEEHGAKKATEVGELKDTPSQLYGYGCEFTDGSRPA